MAGAWCHAVEQRLRRLLQKELFCLHWKDGSAEALLAKVEAVSGELSAPGLGLSSEDRQRLVSEVDTVIHCAASISFFEHVHVLLAQNYKASLSWCSLQRLLRTRACMPSSGNYRVQERYGTVTEAGWHNAAAGHAADG